MKKLNEHYHNELGKLFCCISDSQCDGNYWCKKENLRFFSKELQYIHILFDLYNYDSDFKIIKTRKKKITLQEEKKIIENYKLFLNSLKEIENFCTLSYQQGNIYFLQYNYNTMDYDLPKVNNIEDLCQYVKVVQVYISSECYEVRLQFLYSYYDIVIYGYLNDDNKPEMNIKSALDIIGVNTITGT